MTAAWEHGGLDRIPHRPGSTESDRWEQHIRARCEDSVLEACLHEPLHEVVGQILRQGVALDQLPAELRRRCAWRIANLRIDSDS